MFRKLFIFTLIFSLTCIFTYAQDETPESKEKEAVKAYTLAFGSGGSYLGVRTKEITKENFGDFGLNEIRGVAIEKVIKDSPAEKAGLQEGDVIIRFNSEAVTSTRKLTRLISEVAPDHKAEITVLRNGSEQNINVTIGKRSLPQFFGGNFKIPEIPKIEIPSGTYNWENLPKGEGQNRLFMSFSSNRAIGISVSTLTEQLGDYFGIQEGKGLLINNVSKDSPAEKAGLRAGDVIVEVDGEEVKTTFELIRKINEKKEGDVNLTIIRNKNRQTISVTPEKRKGNALTLEELRKIESKLKDQATPRTRVMPAPPVAFSSPTIIL